MLEIARYRYRAWKYRLRNEPTEINYLLDQVPEGGIAVDVGAHKGAYLYWLRKKVGPHGKVFAFEPQPKLAQYLQATVARLGWKNVIVENMGVSAKNGVLPLYVPANTSGASPSATFCDQAAETASEKIEIDVVSLDQYFAARGITRIDFLKCDVEGHELEVFQGASQLFDRSQPTLLFECEGRHHADGQISSVLDYLQAHGFDGEFFSQSEQLSLAKFDETRHQSQQGERFWEQPEYCANFAFKKRTAA